MAAQEDQDADAISSSSGGGDPEGEPVAPSQSGSPRGELKRAGDSGAEASPKRLASTPPIPPLPLPPPRGAALSSAAGVAVNRAIVIPEDSGDSLGYEPDYI